MCLDDNGIHTFELMSLNETCTNIVLDCLPVGFLSLAYFTLRYQLSPLPLLPLIFHSVYDDMLLKLCISYSEQPYLYCNQLPHQAPPVKYSYDNKVVVMMQALYCIIH